MNEYIISLHHFNNVTYWQRSPCRRLRTNKKNVAQFIKLNRKYCISGWPFMSQVNANTYFNHNLWSTSAKHITNYSVISNNTLHYLTFSVSTSVSQSYIFMTFFLNSTNFLLLAGASASLGEQTGLI